MHLQPQQDFTRYRFGPFEVLVETGELLKHGRRIRIQRKPFEILAALLEQPDLAPPESC
jgi:DNA-binding winged helix-turn-helix (wHTH) protein